MTSVVGYWSINGNGSSGSMAIFSQDTQGNLEVDVSFQDVNRTDAWTGVWDDGAGQIVLTRQLPNSVTQTYTGYLGDNHPEIALILGGSFTESDVPTNAPRTQFGWFAQYTGPIIG